MNWHNASDLLILPTREEHLQVGVKVGNPAGALWTIAARSGDWVWVRPGEDSDVEPVTYHVQKLLHLCSDEWMEPWSE